MRWGFYRSTNTVESIDDLQDERSRALVERWGLQVDDIHSLYAELEEELKANEGKKSFSLYGEDKTRDIRRLAAGAVIAYELARARTVSLPVREGSIITASEDESMGLPDRAVRTRAVPASSYEQLAKVYERQISLLGQL